MKEYRLGRGQERRGRVGVRRRKGVRREENGGVEIRKRRYKRED